MNPKMERILKLVAQRRAKVANVDTGISTDETAPTAPVAEESTTGEIPVDEPTPTEDIAPVETAENAEAPVEPTDAVETTEVPAEPIAATKKGKKGKKGKKSED